MRRDSLRRASLATLSLLGFAHALPTELIDARAINSPPCGQLGDYMSPTPESWKNAGTGQWLDNWWAMNSPNFTNTTGIDPTLTTRRQGFASMLGRQFLGSPDWTCMDSGDAGNCILPASCGDFDTLNLSPAADIEPAYYVLSSTKNLHGYFMGLKASMTNAGIFAALSQANWANTFYMEKPAENNLLIRELLNAVVTIVGVAACFAAMGGLFAAVVAAGVGALFAGAAGAAYPFIIPAFVDDTYQQAGKMSAALSQLFMTTMTAFIHGNDELMAGRPLGDSGDIRGYLQDGNFVNFGGVNQTATMQLMSDMLTAKAINTLWRQQKIFILGGGPCDDSGGLGPGPQDGKLCRDGKAWYLFFWHEGKSISLTKSHWGYVEMPPGASQFGQVPYQNFNIQKVISSSLDAYNNAGLTYSSKNGYDRALSAIKEGWANPGAAGVGWEGIFTIPVCDIGHAVDPGYVVVKKQEILQEYGQGKVPQWCGDPIPNICSRSVDQYNAFIFAANMANFESPTAYCY
ncbi:MAG: hypothetical protein M1817_006429 [Caeruleum heppii]|nr:MAG: hypothetical protein M1817_006429 [Caeruleum heppii]